MDEKHTDLEASYACGMRLLLQRRTLMLHTDQLACQLIVSIIVTCTFFVTSLIQTCGETSVQDFL